MDNKLLYLDNIILINNKKKWTTDIPYNMSEYFRTNMREKKLN